MIEAPEPKLPPIMVRYTENLKDQIAEISNQFEDDVSIKTCWPPVSYSTEEIATELAELGLKLVDFDLFDVGNQFKDHFPAICIFGMDKEDIKRPQNEVPIEILPFLKQRPELTIFERKPAAVSTPTSTASSASAPPPPPPPATRGSMYHCEFCPYETNVVNHFQSHLDNHKSINAQPCNICNKVFKTPSKLQAHMITHQNIRQHTCVYCEKKFKTPATLKAHMKTHFNFEQLRCTFCDKTFSNETQLKKTLNVLSLE
ncbi:hypothetical protein CEXT_403601 [Caerostris extrusa]|uniref:C2H2-type domain-containing protein n=1 Tax=Caerostris extrusa TaxID=172846 RepID=A0AAV4V038_CAEEX|nr:hypothetical protein CEXT_403601 [Caerostris extrusa]